MERRIIVAWAAYARFHLSAGPTHKPCAAGAGAVVPKTGRVESGLERELSARHDIGPAERAALRAQARAVDRADGGEDTDAVTRANAVYLDLREAAGLSAAGAKPADDFERLMAEAMRPTPGTRDTAND